MIAAAQDGPANVDTVTANVAGLRRADADHRGDAIDNGHDELIVDGTPMNPRLHLAIHEVVAAQIIDNDPPEVLATAQRLLALGRDTHEVLHMLGSAVTEQIWAATHEQRPYDREEHMRALTALPGSWDSRCGPGRTMRPHRRRSRHR